MYFDSFSEFLAMGGHGFYVWLSYSIFVVVIAWNILMVRINRKNSISKAKKTWAREAVQNKESPETTLEDSAL